MNKTIQIDGTHPLHDTRGMMYREFNSDFALIRFHTLLIMQSAPVTLRETCLLEQQISELVKNAVRHGNQSDPRRLVRVWSSITEERTHLVIEDEGCGFPVEEWNEFQISRLSAFQSGNFLQMAQYVSYRTDRSTPDDGGNALFAALEYWNEGVVVNEPRNRFALGRRNAGAAHWYIGIAR